MHIRQVSARFSLGENCDRMPLFELRQALLEGFSSAVGAVSDGVRALVQDRFAKEALDFIARHEKRGGLLQRRVCRWRVERVLMREGIDVRAAAGQIFGAGDFRLVTEGHETFEKGLGGAGLLRPGRRDLHGHSIEEPFDKSLKGPCEMSQEQHCDLLIIGGGAAGVFAAIKAKTMARGARVVVLESAARALQKVKISGGGRCNVTHSCFDLARLLTHYPRGHKQLRPVMSRFGPLDTIRWFEDRGVRLKTEDDGRIFPTTDDSETIVGCLLETAERVGVEVLTKQTIKELHHTGKAFSAEGRDVRWRAKSVLLATGGSPVAHGWLTAFQHPLVPLVPSLFTFNLSEARFKELAGVSLPHVKVSFADPLPPLTQEGPMLFTHWGLSGPAILKLSAWGARALAEVNYRGKVRIDLLPEHNQDKIRTELLNYKRAHSQRKVSLEGPLPLPRRLWTALASDGIPQGAIWGEVSDKWFGRVAETCKRLTLDLVGKSTFKEEFVVAGGLALSEVNLKTMESKRQPGLFVAGELLDVDGLTGGFNLQNAWATGFVAGQGMAERFLG